MSSRPDPSPSAPTPPPFSDDAYWQVLYQVMEYALDTSLVTPIYIGLRPVHTIDLQHFLEYIFVPRGTEEYEATIIREISTSLPVVCLAGPRGCGKTSALAFASSRLSGNSEIKIVRLDFKSLYDQRKFDKIQEGTAETVFRAVIREQVYNNLFAEPPMASRLHAWLLAGPPDEGETFDPALVSELHALSLEALTLSSATAPTRSERLAHLDSWLRDNPAEYVRFQRGLLPLIRTAHLITAYASLTDVAKVILILDNVDRVPEHLQHKVLCACNDGQLATGQPCTTVIAIRTENLRGAKPRPGQGGDLVKVILPDNEEYPALLLPDVSAKHVESVLAARQDYVKHIFFPELPSALEPAAPPASVPTPTPVPETVPDLEELVPIHRTIIREFVENSIDDLTNGSLRSTISIYTDFMKYLNKLQKRGIYSLTDLVKAEEKHLHTLFYLWLRDMGQNHGVVIHDILTLRDEDADHGRFKDSASPHHLIMVCILNMTVASLRENRTEYPTWSNVVSRLTELGFAYPTLQAALGDLMTPHGEQPCSVETVHDHALAASLGRDSACRVRLTKLGTALISLILHKVGYVWSAAAGIERIKKPNLSYFDLDTASRMDVYYRYVRRFAERHLELMALLYREWEGSYGPKWLQRYRHRFGVGRRLQIEQILESADLFYEPHFRKGIKTPFTALLEDYQKLLTEIEDGAVAFDSPRLTGLPRYSIRRVKSLLRN